MKKIVIIYWSGTGNTESMAESVKEGASIDEVEVKLIPVGSANVQDVVDADGVALGCPSMGAEVLEETEMEPFVESLSDKVMNKPMVLFGSYGWGSGEWMQDWEERMNKYGAKLITDSLIINEAPDESGLKQCKELGHSLAESIA